LSIKALEKSVAS